MKPYGTKCKTSPKIGTSYCCERCDGPSSEVKKIRRRKERSKARQQAKNQIQKELKE